MLVVEIFRAPVFLSAMVFPLRFSVMDSVGSPQCTTTILFHLVHYGTVYCAIPSILITISMNMLSMPAALSVPEADPEITGRQHRIAVDENTLLHPQGLSEGDHDDVRRPERHHVVELPILDGPHRGRAEPQG